MTKILIDRAVLEQALEALNASMPHNSDIAEDWSSHIAARRALRAALEQPQGDQEPVAWLKEWSSVGNARTGMRRVDLTPECETWLANMFPTITPLYTHPQPKRQPLTDEQIRKIGTDLPEEHRFHSRMFARAIERAHGIGGEV